MSWMVWSRLSHESLAPAVIFENCPSWRIHSKLIHVCARWQETSIPHLVGLSVGLLMTWLPPRVSDPHEKKGHRGDEGVGEKEREKENTGSHSSFIPNCRSDIPSHGPILADVGWDRPGFEYQEVGSSHLASSLPSKRLPTTVLCLLQP